MLKQRLLTAIILIPVFVSLVLFLSPRHFAIFTGFIMIWGAWEWSAFMGIKQFPKNIFYPVLIFIFLLMTMALIYQHIISVKPILYFTVCFWIIATLFVVSYPRGKHYWSKGIIMRGLLGLIVLIPCWIALNFIRLAPHGTYILLLLFVLIWGADSGAYFFGKKWGRHFLLPAVSPGKTWEGLIGAMLATLVIIMIVSIWMQLSYLNWLPLLIIAIVTVLFSVVGDLFESMLKRQENIKDSGRLLPGHGGLLDRIDSLTAAAPIFAVGLMLVG